MTRGYDARTFLPTDEADTPRLDILYSEIVCKSKRWFVRIETFSQTAELTGEELKALITKLEDLHTELHIAEGKF